MNEEKITERRIQDAVYRTLESAHMLVCPNYTPKGWWECDLFSVTMAGYKVEHEIKISIADFKSDVKKFEERFDWSNRNINEPLRPERITKHDLLAAKSDRGPSRFYYVVPDGMLTAADVPVWAGLKTVRQVKGWRSLQVTEVKKAPILSKVKVSDEVLNHVRGIFYYRYWKLRTGLSDDVVRSVTQEPRDAVDIK